MGHRTGGPILDRHRLGVQRNDGLRNVYQQVIDMGEGGVQTLEQVIGCAIAEAFTLLSGRGVWHPIATRARKGLPARWTE